MWHNERTEQKLLSSQIWILLPGSPPLVSSDVMMYRKSVKHVALWRYVLIGAITLTLLLPALLLTNTSLPPPPSFFSLSPSLCPFSVSLISRVLNSANSGQECPDKLVKMTSNSRRRRQTSLLIQWVTIKGRMGGKLKHLTERYKKKKTKQSRMIYLIVFLEESSTKICYDDIISLNRTELNRINCLHCWGI